MNEISSLTFSCPNEQCKQSIPLPVIREILSEEEFARWERLMLQRVLDVMEDIDWCPRCNSVVVKDNDHEKTQLGQCMECFFAFCTKCREGWHQVPPISLLEAISFLDDFPTYHAVAFHKMRTKNSKFAQKITALRYNVKYINLSISLPFLLL